MVLWPFLFYGFSIKYIHSFKGTAEWRYPPWSSTVPRASAWPNTVRCDDLSTAVKGLSQLGSHDALLLLRFSFIQRAKSSAPASLLTFSRTLVAGQLCLTLKIGHPVDHKQLHTVALSQPPSEGWRPGGETCVFARTSCLFGVCGKHALTPGRHSCWLCLLR